MKLNKIMVVVFALVMAMIAVPVVSAVDSYDIVKVEVNDLEVNGDQTSIDIGETVKVRVVVKGDENLSESKEAKIKVWLGGYEYGSVEDITELFTVHPGIMYSKSLYLDLPNDMESGLYTLHVEVYDQEERISHEYTLFVERERHLVDLVDFNVYPSNPEAGEMVEVTVRLENDGAKDEDVKVIIDVPGLGISQRTWIDVASGDKETTDEIQFKVPKNTETGEYELTLTAFYSNDYKFVEKRTFLSVIGSEPEVVQDNDGEVVVVTENEPKPVDKELVISMDTTSKTVSRNKESMFKVTLASFDAKERAITFRVTGAQLFADVRVDPSFLELEGGQKSDALIFVRLHEDTEVGPHTMMLQVLDDGKLLKEIQLTVIAEEGSSSPLGLDDSTLKIAFVVMVVVLIIIGLLIAFRKVKHDDFPLEPHDERTYY